MTFNEYIGLILALTNGRYKPEYEFGLCYDHTNKAEKEGIYFNGEITAILGEYFDVEVISIHTYNASDTIGVWIVCK